MNLSNTLTRTLIWIFVPFFLVTGASGQSCPYPVPCELRVGRTSETDNINPHTAVGTWNVNVLQNTFEGLVTTDASGKPIPGQAESWDVSEDGLTYTFHLRADAVWSDGHPVSAEDFVIGWKNALMRENSTQTLLLGGIVNAREIRTGRLPSEALGIRAIDERTIEIRLTQPQSFLPTVLSNPQLAPLPLHLLDDGQIEENWQDASEIAFNGPYLIEGPVDSHPLILIKNPHYHDAQNVYFDLVRIWSSQTKEMEQVAEFLADQLDIVLNVRHQQRDAILATRPEVYVNNAGANATYFVFNLQRPAFQDDLVREALSISVPYDIVGRTLPGTTPLFSLLPETIHGYPSPIQRKASGNPDFNQQIDHARNLMEEAGYSAETPLKFVLKVANRETASIAKTLQAIWKTIHVEVTLKTVPEHLHYSDAHVLSGNFDVAELSWVADFNDAYNFLTIFQSTGYANLGSWENAHYDDLLEAYIREPDPNLRKELAQEMLEIIGHQRPFIPLFSASKDRLVSTDISGFEPSAMSWHPFRFMSRRPSN